MLFRSAAGANTVVGGAVNIGTPFALNRMNRYAVKPGKGYSQRVEINKASDAIADKVGEIESRIKDGAVHLEHNKVWLNGNKKIAFTDDPKYIKQYKTCSKCKFCLLSVKYKISSSL